MRLRNSLGGKVALAGLAAATAVAVAALPGCTVTWVPAGGVVYAPGQPPPPQQPVAPAADSELEQLVAPIALYPDPILAELLPASAYPDQISQAAAWLQSNPNPSQADIDAQNWAPAVKALVHYPAALQQLANDPQWTQSLGSAVSQDQASVMAAIQDMRQQAKAAGNLNDSPQQDVVTNGDDIAIQPANPDVVYVPTYNPVTVYVQPTPIVWSVGFPIGVWLGCGIDWGGGFLFVGDWHGPWYWNHGHWYHNAYWHGDRFHAWHHDARFGPAPHIDRAHWAVQHQIRGHEAAFHAAVARHNEIRNTARRQQMNNARSYRGNTGNRGGAPRGGRPEEHERAVP